MFLGLILPQMMMVFKAPGSDSLNESLSDIFAEVVDELNGTGSDFPNSQRTMNQCSTRGGTQPPLCVIGDSTDGTSDELVASGASFNPPAPVAVQSNVELVDDGVATEEGSNSDGCEPFVDFTAGSIALVDRGSCFFVDKVGHAIDAGAVGVMVVNNVEGLINMSGDGAALPIPTLMIGKDDGEGLKAQIEAAEVD